MDPSSPGVTCLLGANVSGKTTLIRAILGLTKSSAGAIRFGERDLTALPTHRIIGAAIAVSLEGRKVFTRCSVENLRLGAYEMRLSDRASCHGSTADLDVELVEHVLDVSQRER